MDEEYLEYTPDFESRSAVSLVRDGANVLVFRTFDKIHGLAGLPIGYTLAPRALAAELHRQGLGDAESLGRCRTRWNPVRHLGRGRLAAILCIPRRWQDLFETARHHSYRADHVSGGRRGAIERILTDRRGRASA